MNEEFVFEGIRVELNRKRVKNTTLKVKPPYGEISLTIPFEASNKNVLRFLNENKEWILERSNLYSKEPRYNEDASFEDGSYYIVFGERLRLSLTSSNNERVERKDDLLMVYLEDVDNTYWVEVLVRDWKNEWFVNKTEEYLDKWQKILDVNAGYVQIKNLRATWGICDTNTGRISISYLLSYLPPICLEYILAHELCHLIERNHSPRFYNILHNHFPNYEEIQSILNNYVNLQEK